MAILSTRRWLILSVVVGWLRKCDPPTENSSPPIYYSSQLQMKIVEWGITHIQ